MSDTKKTKPFFTGSKPCSSCPYRKNAPLQLWDKVEFDKLIKQDKKMFGSIYSCHKKDGSCCRGWLIDQSNRDFPNINLRLALTKNNVKREYLESLSSNTPLYSSIEEMIEANYPTT